VGNTIVTGFQDVGIDIDNGETVGRVVMENSFIGNNAADVSSDDDGIDDEDVVTGWSNMTIGGDPELADEYDLADPDFRPEAGGAAATAAAATVPADPFFTPVTYIGAVEPGGTEWYAGWTTTDYN
jgi:hypothetical protein